MHKSLKALLKDWLEISSSNDRLITGLELDSRAVQPGDLFFAYSNNYIHQAIDNGALAILCEHLPLHKQYTVPLIAVKNLRQLTGPIAAKFYNNPSKYLRLVGVTGTNGKTSCTHFIAQALHLAGQRSAVIGTLGNGLWGHLTMGTLTTPDPISLQRLLADFQQHQVKTVAMETSSHGLDQGRTNGTHFELGIFTNLTRDHLDYHGTIENYARAKKLLFEQPGLKYGILNADDNYGQRWIAELHPALAIYAYSTQYKPAISSDIPLIKAEHIRIEKHGMTAKISTPWGDGLLHTVLLGKFNLCNLLAVVTALGIMGIPLPEILNYIRELKGVTGRMQTFGGGKNRPLVVIDYAHTPDALSKTLQALREHCQGELWCVFGCGGDRDHGKRPEMGKIAEQFADQIILTDDNPRSENPLEIIAQIREGMTSQLNTIVEHDRRRAIAHALSCASPGDVVLIAGKGHENYQQIGQEKIPFSDILEVKMLLLD